MKAEGLLDSLRVPSLRLTVERDPQLINGYGILISLRKYNIVSDFMPLFFSGLIDIQQASSYAYVSCVFVAVWAPA